MTWSGATRWTRHRFVVAAALIAAAAALRVWPLQALASRLVWLTFYPVVMVAAIYGGLSAGLLATGLACLTAVFLGPTFAGSSSSSNPALGRASAQLLSEAGPILFASPPFLVTMPYSAIPIVPNLRKAPRLQFLDTGLLNYFAGLQGEQFRHDDLHSFHKGILAEHVVGQELLALDTNTRRKQCFWTREKSQSLAEVDFVIQHRDMVIPVEVKAGPTGTFRSLHQFIDACPHGYAVRAYSGVLCIHDCRTTAGKTFRLLNLPYFLVCRIHDYLDWMLGQA